MTKKLKILVLDDEPQITRLVARVLKKEGYEVIELNDPKKVEDYLIYTDLSLVVTDLKMPGMDGLEVLDLIKKSKPALPVVFLTGVKDLQTAVEATKSGAAEYLTKPISSRKLIEGVKKHILVDQAVPDSIHELIDSQGFAQGGDAVEPDMILLANEIFSNDSVPEGFQEQPFSNILPGQLLPFSLYVQILNKNTGRYYLRKICREHTVYTTGLRDILSNRGLASAYIRQEDRIKYQEYMRALKAGHTNGETAPAVDKKQVLYGKAVEAIKEIMAAPIENKNMTAATGLVEDMFHQMVEDPITFEDLLKLFNRDDTIYSHSANVCLLAVSFALFLGMEHKQIQLFGLGALFHDLGMNRVDPRILEKRQPLMDWEWREIKLHPERGYTILKDSLTVPVASLKIVLQHHEKDDGTGYPRGIGMDRISPSARLMRLVDKFDSMTTNKPYRKAFPAPEALKRIYLEESSEHFQKMIQKFIQFLGGR